MAKKGVKKWLKYVVLILVVMFALGATVTLITRCETDTQTEKQLGALDYARYALNDETGQADKDDKSSVSSKDFYAIERIKCELVEGAKVKYQLNFYDEEYRFISVREYTQDFDGSGSEAEVLKAVGVKYVRIEILPPADDADGEIGIFEKSGYVDQLKVTLFTESETEESGLESDVEGAQSEENDDNSAGNLT